MSDEVHLDSNIPGNPAYHFTIVPPGTPAKAGWAERAPLVPGAALATRCVHAGVQPDPAYGAVMPPIYQSSTFAFREVCTNAGYDYTRSGNPTRAALEEALALLEGGGGATCTTTGMAAVLVAINLLPHGSHLISTIDCYGGTYRLLEHARAAYGLDVTYLDLADLPALERAFRPNTAMVWVETPSNPLLRLTDIRAVAALARGRGAMTAVDNTFLSPALQRPIEHGADIVVHSTTKYINGHSDVVGGAVIAREPALLEQLVWWANALGLTGSPFDSYLTLRGLRTLDARMRIQEANCAAIADLLADHPQVSAVHYPGLANHPGHAIASRQQDGFGAMLSLDLKGGEDAVRAFVDGLSCFTLAESLGGVESLVAHPATMTHAAMSDDARARAGIGPGLVRLSIGIEDLEDLLADLRAGLDRAAQCATEIASER
jgi:cystathionine gamma-synthase